MGFIQTESYIRTPMLEATIRGDIEQVRALIAQGEPVEMESQFFNETPCQQAIDNGHFAVLQLLLAHLAPKLHGESPESVKNDEFYFRLLENAIRSQNLEILKYLLAECKGLDLNASNSRYAKPLLMAIAIDKLEMVNLLVEYGAKFTDQSPTGQTVLHVAAKHNALKTLPLLLTQLKHEINATDRQGNTALHLAVEYGHAAIVSQLLDADIDVNALTTRSVAALHLAVRKGATDLVELLLLSGKADANVKDYNGSTPLHNVLTLEASDVYGADDNDEDENDDASQALHVRLTKLLLTHNADPNVLNDHGLSPLHLAIQHEYDQVVAELFFGGADATMKTKFGDSPLHLAASYEASTYVWDLLLANRADPLVLNADGKTPLELVLDEDLRSELLIKVATYKVRRCQNALETGQQEELQRLLENFGCVVDPEIKSDARNELCFQLLNSAIRNDNLVVFRQLLTTSGVDLSASSINFLKPLFEAVNFDKPEMVAALLAHGANAKDRDQMEQTVLHIAAKQNALKALPLLLEQLKDEVDAKDRQGNTALHHAISFGTTEMVSRLIDAGANVNALTSRSVAPLHMAVRKGAVDQVKLLLTNGKADPNVVDYNGNAPLHDVLTLNVSDLEDADDYDDDDGDAINSQKLHVQLAELLLTSGADANALNGHGVAALHLAIQHEYYQVVQVLLSHGANVNLKTTFSDSPLHVAARFEATTDVWKLLLEHQADCLAVNAEGKTPLEIVGDENVHLEVRTLLLNH